MSNRRAGTRTIARRKISEVKGGGGQVSTLCAQTGSKVRSMVGENREGRGED